MTTTPKVWRATQQANVTDAGVQSDPTIVDIGSGRFVAVWTEAAGGPIATSPGSDLVGQIFDARGNPIGGEFQANLTFVNDNEKSAAIDTRPGGGFVMVYEATNAAGTSIRLQIRDVNGAPVAFPTDTIQVDSGADDLFSRRWRSDPTAAFSSSTTGRWLRTEPSTWSAASSAPPT
jgi:hypothetical protein